MVNNNIKIVFMGTPKFAARILKSTHSAGYNIVGVITQPDKTSGRGKITTSPEVKTTAESLGLQIYQPNNKNEVTNIVKMISPDLIITAIYKVIIPKEALEIPRFGALNVHPSLLPKYRGPSPIVSAILNGDTETGVTIIKMTMEMDEGPILGVEKVQIKEDETTETLSEKLVGIASELILDIIPNWVNGSITERKQDDSLATYTKIIKKEDGRINWTDSSEKIERMIRAFTPWPGTFTYLNGKILKIINAGVSNQKLKPGVINFVDKKVLVGTGTYALIISKLQIEGKKAMSSNEFINGYNEIDGIKLE